MNAILSTRTFSLLYCVALFVLAAAWSSSSSAQTEQTGAIDTIAAIVNSDVITMRTVNKELQSVKQELSAQDIPLPDDETLSKQILQRLITEKLLEQEADELGITISDDDVQRAVELIAQNNDLDEEGLRREIKAAGVGWDDYLASLRHDILVDQLRFRTVDELINISESEIDAYLASRGFEPTAPAASVDELIELSQIVVRVPEASSIAQEREVRAKAESILSELQSGADFATLAASFSDGDEALSGGHIGTRPLDGWPDVFIEAIQNLRPGEVSTIVRSGQGFHIFKVTNRGVPEPVARQRAPAAADEMPTGPVMVTQTHARHILIKLSQVMTDEQAQKGLQQIQQRIAHGEDFADLARSYSEDPSAPQGGDLGWLSPGETVPAFEQAMDALSVNEVSAPVRSPFGWHLIQVLERRQQDMSTELRRLEARQKLFEQYAEPAFEDWLAQVRGQAYIENRLDPSTNSRRNMPRRR